MCSWCGYMVLDFIYSDFFHNCCCCCWYWMLHWVKFTLSAHSRASFSIKQNQTTTCIRIYRRRSRYHRWCWSCSLFKFLVQAASELTSLLKVVCIFCFIGWANAYANDMCSVVCLSLHARWWQTTMHSNMDHCLAIQYPFMSNIRCTNKHFSIQFFSIQSEITTSHSFAFANFLENIHIRRWTTKKIEFLYKLKIFRWGEFTSLCEVAENILVWEIRLTNVNSNTSTCTELIWWVCFLIE